MADVVIVLCNETWWCVRGEAHIDAVLAGTEPADLTISLISRQRWPEVMQLWESPEVGRMPWAINPKIIERVKTRPKTSVE